MALAQNTILKSGKPYTQRGNCLVWSVTLKETY